MTAISRRLALIAGAGTLLAACNKSGGSAGAATMDDMSLGQANAPVKVVEYASLSCPHCMRFNNEVFPAFKAKYIDTGKVHYTFRELANDPIATGGALVARCAGKDKYFGVVDEWYRTFDGMLKSNDQDYRGGLLKVARSAGMTEAQFNACVSNADSITALSERAEKLANKDKIAATPTFIIGGQKLEGEQTLATLDAAIQPLLK